ncbi:hypothetical protein [Enterobacter sp. PTB]|uniref:hypothetical protein n=1 Tax=Enterobacter sp. PTB TaxID=3143437 RepID=UPI003DA91F71
MRLTSRKKTILSYFEPENREWVTGEIGAPPFDVSGVTYLLHGMDSLKKEYQLESTRRTLEAMVKDGLLERVNVYERRQNRMQYSCDASGVRCVVARYGLPGRCVIVRDDEGAEDAIEGECERVE